MLSLSLPHSKPMSSFTHILLRKCYLDDVLDIFSKIVNINLSIWVSHFNLYSLKLKRQNYKPGQTTTDVKMS